MSSESPTGWANLRCGTGYTVETEQEPLDMASILAYRRVSTVMHRCDLHATGGFIRFVTIDPAELDAALARDAEIH